MDKILGIDLGTNSIGWAIVSKDENKTVLLDRGVCIFQEGVAREKNAEKPSVQERTQARASRRHYFRRRLRKIELLKVLVANNMCPYLPEDSLKLWKEKKLFPLDDDYLTWLRTDDNLNDNPYTDRYRCITEKLDFSKQEDRYCFGRAMYHIVQRRGFLSNRKDSSDSSETGKVKSSISDLSAQIAKAGCTYLGEYFYKLYNTEDKSYQRIRNTYTSREEHYRKEFDHICSFQNISLPLKYALERAIFYQRPLKSQKGLVGKCAFEKNKPKCPVSHPRFEEFRMWQFINSIKVKGPYDEEYRTLTQKEKSGIIPLFLRKSKASFDFEDIEKKIAGKGNYGYIDEKKDVPYRFNYREKSGVTGCPVLSGILSFLGDDTVYDAWDSDLASLYLRAEGKTIDQIVNDIWHALFSFTDDDKLISWLCKNFQVEYDKASYLATKVRVPSGYASLSLKAISRILPFLKKGYRYDEAVFIAGVPNVFSSESKSTEKIKEAQSAVSNELECIREGIVKVDKKTGTYGVIQDLLRSDFGAQYAERIYHPSMIETYRAVIPDTNGNFRLGSPRVPSIKNPMAMRALFRLRALINDLLASGKIDKETIINIEFARGLNNANMRKAIEAVQRNNEKLNRQYCDEIEKLYLEATGCQITASDSDILKYKLWEEQKHICPYTGHNIAITDFIGDNPSFDIEHTVPRSRGGDDSQKNKTLCQNHFNRSVKRNMLPSQLANHTEIIARIESFGWKEKIDSLQASIDTCRRRAKFADTKQSKDSAIQSMHEYRIAMDYWKGKVERFSMREVPSGFSNRQGVDIGIIGRYARMYLQTIFKTYIVKGSTTADFRKAWGLQDEYEKKSRINHAHHCIDAITIACIPKDAYDIWKRYAEENEHYLYGEGKRPHFDKPWPTFTEDVKTLTSEIIVSHHTPDNMGKQTRKRVRIRGKVQYGSDSQPLYVSGATARGSLNKATFYGAIEYNGERKYVIRKSLDSISESDIKHVVDPVVQQKIMDAVSAKGFKKAVSDGIWMNEEKRIPIKKVRLFTPTVTSPAALKKHREQSDKDYKRNYYVVNDGNYCMAIYGAKTKKPSFKLFSNLDAARLINNGHNSLVPMSDDNDLPLSFVLKSGTMVLFYENTPEELYNCTAVELSKRLYKVIGLSSLTVQKKYLYGTIVLRHHLEARQSVDLKAKNGEWKTGEEYRPIIGVLHTQMKCFVEGVDFSIGVDGTVKFFHK